MTEWHTNGTLGSITEHPREYIQDTSGNSPAATSTTPTDSIGNYRQRNEASQLEVRGGNQGMGLRKGITVKKDR